jgi:uncharacterized protein (DUF433 family)
MTSVSGADVVIYRRDLYSVAGMAPVAAIANADSKDRGITRSPGVRGGDACIQGTRLPVWILYRAKLAGASDAKLLEMYPFITIAELRNAWRYAQNHTSEIQTTINKNDVW